MAEALIEETGTGVKRFFCHMCNIEIRIPSAEYNCPHCFGGFVEEISSDGPPPTENLNGSTNQPNNRALNFSDVLRGEIASLLMSRNGPNLEISIEPGRNNTVTVGGGGGSGGGSSGTIGENSGSSGNNLGASNSTESGTSGNVGGGRVRTDNLDNLDNLLMEFLRSFTTMDQIGANNFNSPMFLVGNPGDYVWGREGLDTIVTQLLNQMETSGPPPLSHEKINEIPKVTVTQEEVDTKMRCSVCWEDFRLEELVRKLPCLHLYHEDCIIPWLKLHGTCPICRKSLDDTPDEKAKGGEGVNLINVGDSMDHNYTTANPSSSTQNDRDTFTQNTSSQTQEPQNQEQNQQDRQLRNQNVFNFGNDRDFPLD